MAKLPNKVKVAAFDISIGPLSPEEAVDKWGNFNKRLLRIEMDPNHPSVLQELDTLLHEIFHAVYLLYGLEEEDKEERIVTLMGIGFTQVLRDNPKVLKYINEVLTEK